MSVVVVVVVVVVAVVGVCHRNYLHEIFTVNHTPAEGVKIRKSQK